MSETRLIAIGEEDVERLRGAIEGRIALNVNLLRSLVDRYESSGRIGAKRLDSMVAKFNGKCQDRCGLAIHAGHDEIESGHFGFRHVDCDRARVEAWVRERFEAGDYCSEIQFKIAKGKDSPAVKMMASCYALTYADKLRSAFDTEEARS